MSRHSSRKYLQKSNIPMIRLFFFFLLCAMPYTSSAQFGAGSKVTRPIKNTELLVVLAPEYGDAYNDALQAAVNSIVKTKPSRFW
jgi:hypothetical protein